MRGSPVLAQSVNPEPGRVVYALYETYSCQAGPDAATLTAIVTNPHTGSDDNPGHQRSRADIELMVEPN